MSITNTEKQARFRKKEVLKRGAEQIFKEWQMHPMGSRTPAEEVYGLLEKACELPPGWTDGDYANAMSRLEQLRLDFLTNSHDLSNDVNVARSTDPNTGKTRLGNGAVEKAQLDVEVGYDLARHLISAIKLSKATEVAATAAIMEVVRSVGRDLLVAPEIPRSRATTACIAALPEYHSRPDWFAEEMAALMQERLGRQLCREIAEKLLSGRKEWP